MMVSAGHEQIEIYPRTSQSFLFVLEQLPLIGTPLNSMLAQMPIQIFLTLFIVIEVLYTQIQCVAGKSSSLVHLSITKLVSITDYIYLLLLWLFL